MKREPDLSPHAREILDLMRPLRGSVARVRAGVQHYDEAQEFVLAIDRFAGALTGDPEYFWAKPHSICTRQI